jgi:AAA15 family ATPase/GTPase
MIRKISFSNFYSFEGPQEISFLAKKKNSYDYMMSDSGDQISKVSAFVGGNASGKTNVMRVFGFLGFFLITSSKDRDPGDLYIPYKNFFDNDVESKFKIEFEIEDKIFVYELSLIKNEILREKLSFKEIKPSAKPILLFDRKKNVIESLHKSYFENITSSQLPKIRADISFIPFVKSLFDVEIINQVFNFFSKFNTNINERGEINNILHQFEAIRLYEEDKDIKDQMLEVIKNLSSFEIEKESHIDKSSSYTVQGVHDSSYENNKIDFIYESRGTQHLFFILAKLLKAIKEDGIAIIDEMEIGFHPEALNKILTYFIDENADHRGQLIFSSQSLTVLNKLDMHQIYLVEKDNAGESSVVRLNKKEGVRSDENYLTKYLSGSYGAYPKIKI